MGGGGPTPRTAPDGRKENTMTTTTTTTVPVYLYGRLKGAIVLNISRTLDDIVQGVGVDFTSRWEEDRHAVQSNEALWAAPKVLAAVAAANSTADLADLADEADETSRARQDDGRGWQAEVWMAIAAQLRRFV